MKSLAIPVPRTALSRQQPLRRIIHADKLDFVTDQEVYIEAIIEAIHEPILILEKDLTIQAVNKAFLKKFKETKKTNAGQTHISQQQYTTSKETYISPETTQQTKRIF